MEKLRTVLKDNHIQVTQQRLEVLRVLRELNTHLTVDNVRAALEQRQICLTTATVYNILNLFEKKGLIMKINTAGEPVIYDVNTYDHAHICDAETRTVRDFDDSELLTIVRDYLDEHPIEGLDLQRVDINLIGCDHCPDPPLQ